MNTQKRPLFIATIVLIISIGNYSRLSGTECIRPIHMLSLLTMGAAIGIILNQFMQRFRKNN